MNDDWFCRPYTQNSAARTTACKVTHQDDYPPTKMLLHVERTPADLSVAVNFLWSTAWLVG